MASSPGLERPPGIQCHLYYQLMLLGGTHRLSESRFFTCNPVHCLSHSPAVNFSGEGGEKML